MKKKLTFTAWLYYVEDTHGNCDYAYVEDGNETIHLFGLEDTSFNSLSYDDDAKHLLEWCQKNNLKYLSTEVEKEIEVDFSELEDFTN